MRTTLFCKPKSYTARVVIIILSSGLTQLAVKTKLINKPHELFKMYSLWFHINPQAFPIDEQLFIGPFNTADLLPRAERLALFLYLVLHKQFFIFIVFNYLFIMNFHMDDEDDNNILLIKCSVVQDHSEMLNLFKNSDCESIFGKSIC